MRALRHPTRLVPLAFLLTIAVGTALLMLPVCRRDAGSAPFLVALFTSTSAVCVVGLSPVDTATYWSDTGLLLITVFVQIGGFGIVAGATMLGLVVSQRLGLRSRLIAQAETTNLKLGDVRTVLARIALTLLGTELAVTLALSWRFWSRYDYSPGRALWYGLFHAVQAVNNAGMTLYSNGLIDFARDAAILLPLAFGTIIGALGFPALFELVRRWRRPGSWTLNTRLTIWGSLILLAVGLTGFLAFGWDNPKTLGPLGVEQKLLSSFFLDSMTRSGGMSAVDIGEITEENKAIIIALMFIGGGSASTAGGIKVSTFFLLAFVIWAELRGEPDVVIGRHRIAHTSQRQAITVVLLAVALVTAGTLALVALSTGVDFTRALFEATSAFGTVGLSTGLSQQLAAPGQVVLILLMFVGRVGSVTVGSALALNVRHRLYRYPEERIIVG